MSLETPKQGHQGGRRVFWERRRFFKLYPIVSNDVQHIFPGEAKIFLGGASPPPWLRASAQGSVFCKWAEIHYSRWRRSSTLGWYSRVTKVGTKGLIHGYVKQTQFCVSFTAPWWRNGSFQKTQSLQFLNRSLFRFSPMVINLGWRLKKCCQRNKRQRWDICEEFSG